MRDDMKEFTEIYRDVLARRIQRAGNPSPDNKRGVYHLARLLYNWMELTPEERVQAKEATRQFLIAVQQEQQKNAETAAV